MILFHLPATITVQTSFDFLQTNAQTKFEIQLFQIWKKILNVYPIENSCLIIQKTKNITLQFKLLLEAFLLGAIKGSLRLSSKNLIYSLNHVATNIQQRGCCNILFTYLGNRQMVDACLTFCGQRPLDLYYYYKSLEHLFWSEKPLKLLIP